LHRNFAHCRRVANSREKKKETGKKRERERICIEKYLTNMRTHIPDTCVTVAGVSGERAGREREKERERKRERERERETRTKGVRETFPVLTELTIVAACAGNAEDRMAAVLFAGQFADCSSTPLLSCTFPCN